MKTCFFNHYICNLAFLSLTSVLTTEAKMAHRFTQLVALILSLHISSTFAQSLPTHLYTLSQDSDEFFSATAELFERWTEKHGKAYESAKEKERRFENFRRNLKYVAARKSRMDGSSGHAVGLNKFADLSNEEFKQTYLMAKKKTERSLVSDGNVSDSKTREKVVTCDAPAWLDWRKRGVVTPVKNQGACGSCWAFSATGAMEGINAIVTGDLISLSEQELLDCDEFDNGCGGGNMDTAFGWVVLNGGIDSEAGYPYKGFVDRCNIYKMETKVVTIDGYEDVFPLDSALRCAVANQPVSVGIDGSALDFQLYTSGIYDGDCSSNPDDVDHAILIVGYGSNGYEDYWIAKNSWGPEWGMDGYVLIKRNTALPYGVCAINSMASYPTKEWSPAPGPVAPPPPSPPPPPPPPPPTYCGDFTYCPPEQTCCCTFEKYDYCLMYGCCEYENAICCAGTTFCCPQDFPICDVNEGLCYKGYGDSIGIAAKKRTMAKHKLRWTKYEPSLEQHHKTLKWKMNQPHASS